ncbi:MAG TPA: methyltransferase domain-containing protein [Trebonia sp.]|nr:methyltransferase domain-containing protein [Trebonia sp.]
MNEAETAKAASPEAGPVAAGFDVAASAYDTTGTEFFSELAGRLVRAAGIRPGERVADLGCGKGAAALLAAAAAGPGGHVTGIDTSPAMLSAARAAARERELGNVVFRLGNAVTPPLPPRSVHVVMASSVLQFLPSPADAAQRWARLLTAGGRLAISWGMAQDPRWLPVMETLDAAVPAPHPGIEEHLRRAPFGSPEALHRMLGEAGFSRLRTFPGQITSEYRDAGQWWDAARGQAPWVVSWRHIPAAELPAVRERAFTLIERLRDGDGLIRRTLTFGCTIGRGPGTAS